MILLRCSHGNVNVNFSVFSGLNYVFPPRPAEKTGSVGSGSETMGAEEFVNGKAGFQEMEEDDNFSDSELVYHVRDALSSVSSVSILPRAAAYCFLYALGCIS